jgi:hypothetical protein
MPIEVQCPGCNRWFRARDESAGKRLKCPSCGQPILIRSGRGRGVRNREAAEGWNEDAPSRWRWYVAGLVAVGVAVAAVFVFDLPAKLRKGDDTQAASAAPKKEVTPSPTPQVSAEPEKLPPIDEFEALDKLNRLNARIGKVNFVANAAVALDFAKELTDDDLAYLRGLPKLERLSLYHTGIGDKGLPHLRRLPNLTELILSGTKVTDKGMPHVGALTKLRLLGLSNTDISDEGVKHLAGLSLFALELAGTAVGDSGLGHLKNMSKVMRLQLSSTRITDAGLVHLAGMMKGSVIHDLYLSGTSISDAGIEHLMTMTDLTHVHLDGTRVSEAGVARLKQALPKLKVMGR